MEVVISLTIKQASNLPIKFKIKDHFHQRIKDKMINSKVALNLLSQNQL